MRALGWRWGVVAAGVAALVALPLAVRALPAADDGEPAAALLARVQGSTAVGYSGYAEALGGLRLPLTDDFAELTGILGERSRLRIWWRGERDWRVDTVQPTGERGVYRDQLGIWTWEYERGTSVRTSDPEVRLPRAADLDPAALGHRLLSEARPGEVSRIPARRVADRSAAGLRLRPSDPGSTIEHVDVWVDRATGLPLRVELDGAGAGRPVLETGFLDVDLRRPPAATTRFDPPYPGRVHIELNPDPAAAINVFAPVVPPTLLAGLSERRRVAGLGSVGTYGSGLTLLVAVPLPGRISRPLREQLARTPGAAHTGPAGDPGTVRLSAGPLSLLLTDPPAGRSWLLTGTVTAATLDRAAAELAAVPPAETR